MEGGQFNCLVILGPTATGKTWLAVQVARLLGGRILSADSRQVYRGLDIGSGKDLDEYGEVPYSLIDVADLDGEFNLFDWQAMFYKEFEKAQEKNLFPIIAGGTGLYIDSVVRGYEMVPLQPNPALRAELESKPLEELVLKLKELDPAHHTTSDFRDKARTIKAIEIALFSRSPEGQEARRRLDRRPSVRPLIAGTTFPREILRQNIRIRLQERFDCGMIDEVESLHQRGASWQRLEQLGLEYRFIARYLQGKIGTFAELFDSLNTAIGQFAKRQETWFRGMERKGARIEWLPQVQSKEERLAALRQTAVRRLPPSLSQALSS